jgi:hypothetical protein
MKYVITESQSLFLRRRLDEIDEYVKLALEDSDPSLYIYDDNVNYYVNHIVWEVIEDLGNKYPLDDMEATADYLRDTYWNEIVGYYKNRLGL